MATLPGSALNIDWTDFSQVYDLASKLAAGDGPAMIIFHNGRNYQITHAEKRERVEAQGHNIVFTVGV